ncbi:imelysin family protein [Flexibacterium corallicola]|uniref:imelysin family protein n=1 Tax=Flexibacterium corallicola TaxID=3037259 RepID=UPI00286F5CE3|nr:imelysin family protein [Pseudovibrio sp. M1P-2-3]
MVAARVSRLLGLAVVTTGLLFSPQVMAEDYRTYNKRLVENYIRPQFTRMVSVFEGLEGATEVVCSTPSESAQKAFSGAFTASVKALAQVDFLRFGPLAAENRSQRLAFLPDSRSVTRRQINKLLANPDEKATKAATLKTKSVALQGLTALERIAFGSDGQVILGTGTDNEAFVCSYANAIGQRLVLTAKELVAEWNDPDGYSKELLDPDPSHQLIKTDREAAELTYNSLVTALVIVKDQILLPVVGKTAEKAKPYRAPFARSHNALAYLSANLHGIDSSIQAADYAEGLTEDQKWATDSLTFEFMNAQRTLETIRGPLNETAREPDVRDQLSYLIVIVDGVKEVLATDISGYLGLSGGFNALDGD